MVRGGSWNNDARNVRAAYRNWNHPTNANDNLGFRLAREQPRVGGRVPDPIFILSVRAEILVRTANNQRAPARK